MVPGGKGGNWVVVVEGNWGVDMDKPGTALFVAIVLVAILQAADEAANEAERPPVDAIALAFPPFYMLDRRLDENFHRPLFDVEGGGTEFALATKNLPFFEVPPNHGPLVPVEKR